jgi:hypothetical protein
MGAAGFSSLCCIPKNQLRAGLVSVNPYLFHAWTVLIEAGRRSRLDLRFACIIIRVGFVALVVTVHINANALVRRRLIYCQPSVKRCWNILVTLRPYFDAIRVAAAGWDREVATENVCTTWVQACNPHSADRRRRRPAFSRGGLVEAADDRADDSEE